MNVLVFSGNLGRDVKMGNAGGTDVGNFAVAMKSGFGDKEQTVWVDCALWGKRATSLEQSLVKGQQVVVSGEMGLREYEKDGVTKTAVTCRVSDVTLVGGKPSGQAAPAQQQTRQAAPAQRTSTQQQAPAQQPDYESFDDDIPF